MIALLASGDARYELWDAQCIRMTPDYLVLSGYSREHDKTTAEVDYAQTWVMKLAGTDDTQGRHAAGVT